MEQTGKRSLWRALVACLASLALALALVPAAAIGQAGSAWADDETGTESSDTTDTDDGTDDGSTDSDSSDSTDTGSATYDSDKHVASVTTAETDEDGESTTSTLYYETAQGAADAVAAGGTLKLLADVTLSEDTGVAIVNKGSESSRVTVDLNGHTLTGDNAGSGASKGYYYDADSSNARAGILQVVGSYVTLTDSSTGDTKGTISNTNDSSTKFAAVAVMLTYDVDKTGTTADLVIEGGVNVSSSGTATGGTSQGAVYLYGASGKVTSKLTVSDATITGPYAVTTYSTGSSYFSINIEGGTFTSTKHAGDSYGAIYAVSDGASQLYTISGGTFNSWTYYQFQSLAEDYIVTVAEDTAEDGTGAGAYLYTVTKEVPTSYVASVTLSGEDTPTYYQTSGNLYGLQLALDQSTGSLYGYPSGGKTSVYFKGTGATISVVANASYTMASGDFLGPLSGTTVYLTFELAENVTLSGSIALGVAQLTVSGKGTAMGFSVSAVTSYGTGTYAGTTNTLTLDSKSVDSTTGLGTYYCYLSDAAALVTYEDESKAYYTSGAAAITKAAVNENSTVTLLADVSTANASIGVSKSFTLDLAGHTLTLTRTSDTASILTISGASAAVTVTDTSEDGGGTIKDTGSASLTNKSMFYLYGASSSLTLTNVTIQMYGAASSGYNEVVYADTTSSSGSPTVTFGKGATVEEIASDSSAGLLAGAAIFGYYDTSAVESIASDYAGTTVKVLDGASIEVSGPAIMGEGTTHGTTVEVSGGTLTSTEGAGIYLPEYGTATVSGGTISGALCGIEVRAGTLNVTGGTIKSAAETFSATANGSGTTVEGAAVAVSQHSTNLATCVNVTGGALSGIYGLYEEDLQDSTTDGISLAISGGTFAAGSYTGTDDDGAEQTLSGAAVYSADCTGFVTGGYFTDEVASAYIASGYSSATATVSSEDEDGEDTAYTVDGVEYPYTVSPVSIEFLGGSLRTDSYVTTTTADDGTSTYSCQTSAADLRFGYTLASADESVSLVAGSDGTAADVSWGWTYSTKTGSKEFWLDGSKYAANEDGSVTSNLVLSGITSSHFATEVYSTLSASYTTEDGVTVTVTDDKRTRCVAGDETYGVANLIKAAYTSDSTKDTSSLEYTYATKLLEATSSSSSTTSDSE